MNWAEFLDQHFWGIWWLLVIVICSLAAAYRRG